jgi:hypothetical protein
MLVITTDYVAAKIHVAIIEILRNELPIGYGFELQRIAIAAGTQRALQDVDKIQEDLGLKKAAHEKRIEEARAKEAAAEANAKAEGQP